MAATAHKSVRKNVTRARTLRAGKKKAHLKLVKPKRKALMTDRAREQLILDHMQKGRQIAHSLLKRWRSRLEAAEVDSVVDLSLCEAAARFDPSKGVSFITFLFYHLKGNLVRLVIDASTRNFIPVSELEATEGLESWHNKLLSVGAADALRREAEASPYEVLEKKELASVTMQICSKLSPVEQEIVHRIFVLEEQVLDVAEALGYSRCHVSRIKTRALELLEREIGKVEGYQAEAKTETEIAAPKLRLIKPRRARREATITFSQGCAA